MENSPRVLERVAGLGGRFNNLIYTMAPPTSTTTAFHSLVVYFGGDIQNFHSAMSEVDSKYCDAYCLESMATKLSARFAHSDILIVQPNFYYNDTFSCYSNFYQLKDSYGTPRYDSESVDAYRHLVGLIRNAARLVGRELPEQKVPVTLVAFSKGSSVVNQLIRCLNVGDECSELRIEHIYFLDSGHNGPGVWITDESLVRVLQSRGIEVSIALTAYQAKQRQYIEKEERQFTSLLARLGVPHRRIYKANTAHSYDLMLHFSVIDDLIAAVI